jgi:chemotaxis protein methyltransferase CheR
VAFTFFFRDCEALEQALDAAMPSLRGRAFIHIWDAGCAHGPEPYTLAILLRQRMSDYVFRNVHIHATDIDASFAASVSAGVFAQQEVQRVPPEILQKYFRPAGVPLASGQCEKSPSSPMDAGEGG